MRLRPLALVALGTLAAATVAGRPAMAQTEQSTTLALIQLLIEEGILSRDKAQSLLVAAEQQARAAEANQAASGLAAPPGTPPGAVRVPYVPQVVRDEIRDQVKEEVLAQARTERWGDPGTLPEWIDGLKIYGDVRVRGRADTFGSGNRTRTGNAVNYPDYMAINEGDFDDADAANGNVPFLNTTQDEERLQLRARLGVSADLGGGFSTDFRIATGNELDPVSTNSNLANYLGNQNINLDRAYIRYRGDPVGSGGELMAEAGRFDNPFFSTDLVWDDDVNFDGVASTFTYPVSPEVAAFATAAFLPLQFVSGSSNDTASGSNLSALDKYLYAAQLGLNWTPADEDYAVKFGAAYYYYDNVRGNKNGCNSDLDNVSTPQFQQNGNSNYEISCVRGQPGDDDFEYHLQYGLASDFEVLNLTGQVDVSSFDPIHVILTGDLAINTAWDEDAVNDRVIPPGADRSDEAAYGGSGNLAWLARVLVGHPEIREANDWNVILTYKYLQRDSVLDAFNDSDFHLGGTDAQGFSIFGNYAIANNVWIGGRWISTEAVDGPTYDVDTYMLELNARF
jgi:hypothetical protein